MTLLISADPVPLRVDEHGTVRVGGTRLTLDSVIAVYRHGQSAEEIAQSFDGLALADVHAILAYYLHHQTEVDTYLAEQDRIGDAVQRELEALQGPSPFRQRLQRARPAS